MLRCDTVKGSRCFLWRYKARRKNERIASPATMFSFDPSFDGPLIPHNDNWPVFDEVIMFSPISTSSSLTTPSPSVQSDPLPPPFPSSTALAAMPIPPSRASPRNKNPNHIPRPRNAFMLFRSAFAAAQKISANIEHDNRHITRVIAHCWNSLSEVEKQIWRDKAAAEKVQHAEQYPHYRFRPIGRAKKPKKRKVRRNGVEDVKRCETLANLVMAGKHGRELERALDKIQTEHASAGHSLDAGLDVFSTDEMGGTLLDFDPPTQDAEADDVPPFRSPLLPPARTTPQQVLDQSLMPQVSYTVCSRVRSNVCPAPCDSDCTPRRAADILLSHSL